MAEMTVTLRLQDRNPLIYRWIARIIALFNPKKSVAFYAKRVYWKIEKLCDWKPFVVLE